MSDPALADSSIMQRAIALCPQLRAIAAWSEDDATRAAADAERAAAAAAHVEFMHGLREQTLEIIATTQRTVDSLREARRIVEMRGSIFHDSEGRN